MKKTKQILWALLTLLLLNGACASADDMNQLQFSGGLQVRLSAEWNTMETHDEREETGAFQTVISLDGENLCEIVFVDTEFAEPEYETEILDWFKDDVPSLFPKGTRFTIKDISTGKTFEAFCFSGRNHMDTEPCSAEDAAVIKEIYGGQYAWDFRPILIRYEGHVYAASMNGKPHAKSATENNDFNGHFCVHFKNSWLHEEWVVSDAHQAMILKAAGASW